MYLDWHLILNVVVAFLIGSWIWTLLTKPSSGDGFWATEMLFRRRGKALAKLVKKLGLESDHNLTGNEIVRLAKEKGIDTTAYENTFDKY